jgi:hypothetical protein
MERPEKWTVAKIVTIPVLVGDNTNKGFVAKIIPYVLVTTPTRAANLK